ncbi:P-II family nitrogen regulator [Nitrosomonas sp.]|uniref:P-II family nitrogen regulator n=1 Tax=Nitrosomonas sp. TaxID=42353 RepID=UPI001DC09DF6|nr:transcriptional regulator [Nitrosomonas sp.]MCB1948139.1 transcriptional regulator [Nitrosomonas sp.]MCP5242630.1 transcriptional regulator [Burkholderiales bacterium]MDR4513368.1 transcriptional regulator [Nitrosomonas sp.]
MASTLSMKRVEIVIDAEKLEGLVSLLMDAGVRGYTVLKKAGGLGSRGTRSPDDVLWEEENAVVILACKEDQANKIVDALRPKLKDFGGMCLLSDCEWVEGPPISY